MATKTTRSSKGRKKATRSRRSPRRTRRGRLTFWGVWLGLMVVVTSFWLGYRLWSARTGGDLKGGPPGPIPDTSARRMTVTLYFSDQQAEYLVGEKRQIPRRDRVPERAKAVLEELIRGPRSELLPTIPRGTRVRGVTIGKDSVCTVDFDGTIVRNHPGGTSSELMTVYSIVESLTKNVTGVQTVRILVEGEPRETFAGHLFIGAPLGPEPLYVRRGPS